MITSSQVFHATAGKSLAERIEAIRSLYSSRSTAEYLRKLTDTLVKLNCEAYKEIIVGLLEAKALEWELHRELPAQARKTDTVITLHHNPG